MRYNIKRLFREHETYAKQLDEAIEEYATGRAEGLTYREYSKNVPEINRLRHVMSQVRQYIGQEVVARLREGRDLNVEVD